MLPDAFQEGSRLSLKGRHSAGKSGPGIMDRVESCLILGVQGSEAQGQAAEAAVQFFEFRDIHGNGVVPGTLDY